ncbi:MAG: hypothetical protein COA99_02990 [Moraxellaceae bacterium]|nr:MAG: hypothetical protein COA99_02990 [Moraxellaceae bacterium]
MMRKYNFEQAIRNMQLAEGLSPKRIITTDPLLWRGPRLLVPVELDVLVVDQSNVNDPWADVLFDPNNVAGYTDASTTANNDTINTTTDTTEPAPTPTGEQVQGGRVPFATYETRNRGMYLHWSLPDGLTKGITLSDPEDNAPIEQSDDTSEQDDLEVGENTEFPLVPDRWLVVRFSPGEKSTDKRKVKAWVVKSEEIEKADRIVLLGNFVEDRDNNNDRWFTAIGEGDPGYAAYYDNVEGRLGFYDDMEGVSKGPISYLVSGWYSDKGDDPLYAPQSQASWHQTVSELGWAIPNDADGEDRLKNLVAQRKHKEMLAGLDVSYDDFFAPQDYAIPEQNLDLADAQATSPITNRTLKGSSATLFDDGLLNIVNNVMASANAAIDQRRTAYFTESIASAPTWAEQVIVAADRDFLNHWPRQMLCHSMTYGIQWNNAGGYYDPENSGKPQQDNLTISVGNTGVEALSALLAENAQHRHAERIYNSHHYGLLPEIQQQDGLATLESLLHSEDFESRPGGFVTDSIMEGDLFPNLSSTEANRVKPGPFTPPSRKPFDKYHKQRTPNAKTVREIKRNNSNIPNIPNSHTSPNNATFTIKRYDITLVKEELQQIINPNLFTRMPKPRKSVAIRKAMPRYWQPKDPVILFSEAKRSYKHGEDNRFTADGRLLCRLTGETVTSVGVNIGQFANPVNKVTAALSRYNIKPQHITSANIDSGQIPLEAQSLFDETLLLDLDNARIAAHHIDALKNSGDLDIQYPSQYHSLDELTIDNLTQRYQVNLTLEKNRLINEEVDSQLLASISASEGLQPSEFAQKAWRKPWTPLHMDWQVEWYPNRNHRENWHLDEHDYDTNDNNDRNAGNEGAMRFNGSTLLTPAVTRSMADRLDKFIAEEDLAEPGSANDIANENQELALGELRDAMKNLDVLAGNIAGFHDFLLGKVDDYQFTPYTDENGAATEEKTLDTLEKEKRNIEHATVFPVRAGHFKLIKLRVVDTFGQFVDVDQQRLENPVRAEDMESSVPSLMRLPPRIVQPSRLMFRMVQAENDQQDATKDISPICGWLLPDHLDEALEFYDPSGHNVGQIQRCRPNSGDIVATSLEWQGVPGNPGSFGAPPAVGNQHLQGMVNGLLAAGEQDARRALEKTLEASNTATTNPTTDKPTYSNDTALGAMLRMIDSTLWTVDPLGREGDEHLSVLVGRPLAVVRACLRLETMELETQGDLSSTAFDVRLGELTRLGDGLVGYYINDDYSQFYPIHEEIANQTRPTRPHHGYLGAIQTVQNYYQNFASKAEPVKHPYINEKPFVSVRPVAAGIKKSASKSVMLTLIIDPRGGVHATCGILPRKRIELLREHVAEALENMSITFRIGPVLTNPETVRMPLPSEIQGNWNWVRKTGLTVWQESPVVDAVPEPKLSHTPAQIQEGWLKLSGAQSTSEET